MLINCTQFECCREYFSLFLLVSFFIRFDFMCVDLRAIDGILFISNTFSSNNIQLMMDDGKWKDQQRLAWKK